MPSPVPTLCPTHLNALPKVLLLLLLEGELNEELLQLLVAVVYAKLLKAVLAEDLKPVDVQDAHHILPSASLKQTASNAAHNTKKTTCTALMGICTYMRVHRHSVCIHVHTYVHMGPVHTYAHTYT